MWEICYDTEEMLSYIAGNEQKLMEDQMGFYNTIVSNIESEMRIASSSIPQVELARYLSSIYF